ncbi:MAG: hypothetical protein WD469_09985 [Paenibacillaceae bacterium]
MNKLKQAILAFVRNSYGGAHIYIFGLLALGGITAIFIISLNVALQYTNKDHTKPLVDIATHAAALDIDLSEAAQGRIIWDVNKGTASFYGYLRKNLHLDSKNRPVQGSYLSEAPIIHYLGLVTNSSYPFTYVKSITLHQRTAQQLVRKIQATLYGPSIVAIVEVQQKMYGQATDEPIVISSVSSIRNRF